MLTSHFTFQDDTDNFILFVPIIENHVGEGEEAFLTDYPKNILLNKDLELVPWMVGLTSSDGALMTAFLPDLFQAGETKFLYQKRLINLFHLETEMVSITRWACHLKIFWTTVIKLKANNYLSYLLCSHPTLSVAFKCPASSDFCTWLIFAYFPSILYITSLS